MMSSQTAPLSALASRRKFLQYSSLGLGAAYLGVSPTPTQAALSGDQIAGVRAFMTEELAREPYPIPGVVLTIGTPREILFNEAVGLAQVIPQEIPMRLDTIFDIASTTKVVTASTACALCVDRGLLDPDAPMSKYLPDHKGKDIDKISLRALASHSSGFAADPRLASWGKGEAFFNGMLQESPSWPVGTKYQYADRNITILGVIVERVTGRSFGDFCQEEIFAPLGMKDSVFNSTPHLDRVAGTHIEPGISHNNDTLAAGRAIAAVGLFTTSADLTSLCRVWLTEGMHGEKRFLSKEVIRDFTKTHFKSEDGERAFIWATGPESYRPDRLSTRAYGHAGWTGTTIWVDPEKQLFVVVLGNRIHPRVMGENSRIPQYEKLAHIADRALEALGI